MELLCSFGGWWTDGVEEAVGDSDHTREDAEEIAAAGSEYIIYEHSLAVDATLLLLVYRITQSLFFITQPTPFFLPTCIYIKPDIFNLPKCSPSTLLPFSPSSLLVCILNPPSLPQLTQYGKPAYYLSLFNGIIYKHNGSYINDT